MDPSCWRIPFTLLLISSALEPGFLDLKTRDFKGFTPLRHCQEHRHLLFPQGRRSFKPLLRRRRNHPSKHVPHGAGLTAINQTLHLAQCSDASDLNIVRHKWYIKEKKRERGSSERLIRLSPSYTQLNQRRRPTHTSFFSFSETSLLLPPTLSS